MEGFHQRCGIGRHGDTGVADVFHGAAVEAAETYSLATALLRVLDGTEQVLGPHAGFIFAGAAMHAQADEHVAGGELGDELLDIKVIKAVVIDIGQHHGYVVVEALGLESAPAFALHRLDEVAGEMGGGGGGTAVAAGIDPFAVLPGAVKDVNGLIDVCLIYFLRYLRRLPQVTTDKVNIGHVYRLLHPYRHAAVYQV